MADCFVIGAIRSSVAPALDNGSSLVSTEWKELSIVDRFESSESTPVCFNNFLATACVRGNDAMFG